MFFTRPGFAIETQMGLSELYEQAVKQSETVATQLEQVNQANERHKQARGGLFPTVSGVASYKQQDSDIPSGAASSVYPSYDPLIKLTATQPLFRGLREFAALRQARALTDVEAADLAQAKLTLFNSVA